MIPMHRGVPVLPDQPTKAELEAFVELTVASKAGREILQHPFDRDGEGRRLRAIADRFIARQVELGESIEGWGPIEDAILAALRAEYAGVEVPWGHLNLAHQVALAAESQYRYAQRRAREIADAESARHSDALLDDDRRAADAAHALAEVEAA